MVTDDPVWLPGRFRMLRHAVLDTACVLGFRGESILFGLCNSPVKFLPGYSPDWPDCLECQVQLKEVLKKGQHAYRSDPHWFDAHDGIDDEYPTVSIAKQR
jgi:hypothetical protein